jgi:hypothetical protein
MSERDANRDDMSFFHPLDIDDPDLGPVVEEVRTLFRRHPDPAVEARHVSAMIEVAKAAPGDLRVEARRGNRPVRPLARLAIVAAAFGLLTGGLALAGVDIPGLSDRVPDESSDQGAKTKGDTRGAEDSTGEVIVPSVDQLPENAGDASRNVIATIESNLSLMHTGELSGCEFGAMVSAAARGAEADSSHCEGKETGGAPDARSDTAQRVQAAIDTNLPLLHDGEISGCEFGAIVSAAARDVEPDDSKCGDENVEAGGSQGAAASDTGKARAEEAKTAGRAKGEEASKGKSEAGGVEEGGTSGPASKGKGASEDSPSGVEHADEAKAAGRAKGEEASGGKANPGGKSPKD